MVLAAVQVKKEEETLGREERGQISREGVELSLGAGYVRSAVVEQQGHEAIAGDCLMSVEGTKVPAEPTTAEKKTRGPAGWPRAARGEAKKKEAPVAEGDKEKAAVQGAAAVRVEGEKEKEALPLARPSVTGEKDHKIAVEV